MTAAEVLRKAAANIHAETWCQWQYATSDGRGCALWHIQQASIDDHTAGKAAAHAVYLALPEHSLVEFNDAEDRTCFDVVELFEQVAATLEQEAACSVGC